MKTSLSNFKALRVTSLLTSVVCAAALLTAGAAKAAGGVDSGGGGAYECADGKTYLLDLEEASNPYIYQPTLKIVRSNENADEQLRKAVSKLAVYDSYLPDLVYNTAQELFDKKVNEDPEHPLLPPRDALVNYGKKNCELKGMMYFEESIQKLVVNPSRLSRLASNTDRAAARVHEAWFYLARQAAAKWGYKVNDSVNSRKMVACLFSTSTTCLKEKAPGADSEYSQIANLKKLDPTTMKGPILNCVSPDMEMTVHTALSPIEMSGAHDVEGSAILLKRWKDRTFDIGALMAPNYSVLGEWQTVVAAKSDYMYGIDMSEAGELLVANIKLNPNEVTVYTTKPLPSSVQNQDDGALRKYGYKQVLKCNP